MTAVVRHVAWNIAGTGLAALAGLVAMPVLVRVLDTPRLGAFTLALSLAGLSGLLDLGLGRGLTRYVAAARGNGLADARILPLVRRVLSLLAAAGAVLAIALWFAAPSLATALVGGEGAVGLEFERGLRWIAWSLPFTLASAGMIGALEGSQRFGLVNALRAPLNALLFLAPVAALGMTRRLDLLMATLAAVRIAGFLVWCVALRPWTNRRQPLGSDQSLADVARFGGWLTLSNVIGPLMVYGDRFYLATIFPPAVLARYTVPLDSVSRASSLPAAAANALFPALARNAPGAGDNSDLVRLSGAAMTLLWFAPIAALLFFSSSFARLWFGANFPDESIVVLQIVLVGVFLNGFAHAPLATLHARGRSDLSAKLHAIELPLYAAMLVWWVHADGIVGAAMAWSARVAFDTLALFVMAAKADPRSARATTQVLCMVAVAGVVLALPLLLPDARWLAVLSAVPVAMAWRIARRARAGRA